jgi:hypothetical protein
MTYSLKTWNMYTINNLTTAGFNLYLNDTWLVFNSTDYDLTIMGSGTLISTIM